MKSTKRFSIVTTVIVLLIVFAAGLGTGIFIETRNASVLTVSKGSIPEFNLVEDAWNTVQENYVDRTAVQDQTLAYGTIAGMVDSLGDTGHSVFLTPQQVKQVNNEEQGKLQGIGVEVQAKNGQIVIVAPIDGSPAQKAGLRSGDIILKVDGQSITTVTQAVSLITGTSGTPVTLTIQDSTGAVRDVTIVRATINLISVTWRMLPDTSIVHLKIASFSSGTAAELDSALQGIGSQNPAGIILDLRNNPGGLLDEAVSVASHFLKSGDVLLEKDARGHTTAIPVLGNVLTTDLPVVVLINQGTASAAEIVSGALLDAGRAKLVGETTFGTGTVLNEFSLPDGSAIMLAIAEWLTPSGKTIWHTGLSPDTTVPLDSGVIPLTPETEQGMTASQINASGDAQLLAALGMLTTR